MDGHKGDSTAPEPKKNLPESKVKRRTKKEEPYKMRKTKNTETASKSQTENTEFVSTDLKPDKFLHKLLDETDGSITGEVDKKQIPDGDKPKRQKRKDENLGLDDISESESNKKQKSKKKETPVEVQKQNADLKLEPAG